MNRPRTSVFIATSVDGFIARPDGGLDWLPSEPDPQDPDEDYGWGVFWSSVDALVMGRNTFDVVASFDGDWPYGDTPVHVLTSHPGDLPRPAGAVLRPVSGTPADVLAGLAAEGVDHVYVDGGATVRQFLRAGSIDRIVLTTVPVLLGEGIPLFGATGGDVPLRLVGTRSWAGGLVQRTYDVVRPDGDRGRPKRLVFGSVARNYDTHRPGYPDALFDHLLARVPGNPSALDIGCGTGRVAAALAGRDVHGVGIEPDPEMAAVAVERLTGTGWTVQVSDFESCTVDPASIDLVTCGQAWHWVDPDRGLARALEVLRPGGCLALFWNRPEWERAPGLRAALDRVYERVVPGMESSIARRGQPPKGRPLATDPAPGGFTDARVDEFRHVVTYTAESWVDLLGTHSNHVLLDDELRSRLHGEVSDVIRAHGGSFELVWRCECWSARRAG